MVMVVVQNLRWVPIWLKDPCNEDSTVWRLLWDVRGVGIGVSGSESWYQGVDVRPGSQGRFPLFSLGMLRVQVRVYIDRRKLWTPDLL